MTNDGVHVYREWAVVHQDFMAALTKTGPQRAAAAETLAQARAEITRRALAVTVTKSYYALLTGQRKYATAQRAQAEAARFLDISEKLENGGEVAHADVIKARIQAQQQQRDLQEAQISGLRGDRCCGRAVQDRKLLEGS